MEQNAAANEIGRLDILDLLHRYKWLIFIVPTVAALLSSFLVFFVLHPAWEAEVVLEMGHIGGQINVKGELIPLEPALNVVSRLKSKSFVDVVLSQMTGSPEELNEIRRRLNSLKVAKVKEAELVEFKVRGSSPELAKKLALSCIAALQSTNSASVADFVERNNQQIQLYDKNLAEVTREIELLKSKLLESHNWNTFDANLAASILNNKTADFRDLIQKRRNAEYLSSPLRTYNLRPFGDVAVGDDPVSPNSVLIIGLAIFLGLAGALIAAFIHRSANIFR